MDEGSLSDTQRTMVLPLLQETNIRGKPYITVSAKGIVNGLSRYPNDGADFGPDTTKGATAPGQYGAPYTQTVGTLEAVNYSYGSTNSPQIPIKLLAGHFVISPDATLYKVNTSAPITGAPEYAIIPVPTQPFQETTTENQNISIHGSGGLGYAPGTGIFTGSNPLLLNYNSMTVIDVSQVVAPTGDTVMTFAWDRSVNTDGTNMIDIGDFVIYQQNINGASINIVGGLEFSVSGEAIAKNIAIVDPYSIDQQAYPADTEIGIVIDADRSNVGYADAIAVLCNYIGASFGPHMHVGTYVCQNNYIGLWPTSHHGVDMERFDIQSGTYGIYQTPENYGSIRIHLWDSETYTTLYPDVYIESGSYSYHPETVIENYHTEYGQEPNPKLPSIVNNGTGYYVTVKHIESTPLSIAGTTAGTIQPYVIEYGTTYKKMIFQFNGYENDTTTDQAIGYPANQPYPDSTFINNVLNFTSYAVITANNTGLTISASTTGITITAPDSTTAYSGIVIVEGY